MDIIETLYSFPHLSLGCYPTPIEELPRLRAALGANAPRLFIKRDDYTGLGFGGNKVRKLDYFLAQAISDKAEAVITVGGINSNHCRVTAALCAKLGLRCLLVLNAAEMPPQKPANLFVDELYGAEVHFVRNREERSTTMQALAAELCASGINVCEVPLGASTPLGAMGYVNAMSEIKAQMGRDDKSFDYLFHASSSGGTQAGIVVGCQLYEMESMRVIGVSPDDPAEAIAGNIAMIIRGIGEMLNVGSLDESATVLDDYIGAGYGISTPESVASIQLLARTEGIVLDPTYSAKAMAALLDWIRMGKFTAKDTILFLHSGGQLAHFQIA